MFDRLGGILDAVFECFLKPGPQEQQHLRDFQQKQTQFVKITFATHTLHGNDEVPVLHIHRLECVALLYRCSIWRGHKQRTSGVSMLVTCRCSRKLSSAPADSWPSRDAQSTCGASLFSLPLSPSASPIVASSSAYHTPSLGSAQNSSFCARNM